MAYLESLPSICARDTVETISPPGSKLGEGVTLNLGVRPQLRELRLDGGIRSLGRVCRQSERGLPEVVGTG